MNRDSLLFGLLFVLVFAAITLLLPVELYDGYAVLSDGTLVDEKLSLSYLVQKESFLADYKEIGVVDLRLATLGWILVAIINFGFPLLLGYRIAVARSKKK